MFHIHSSIHPRTPPHTTPPRTPPHTSPHHIMDAPPPPIKKFKIVSPRVSPTTQIIQSFDDHLPCDNNIITTHNIITSSNFCTVIPDKKFKCMYQNCNEAFDAKWSLTRHLRTHTKQMSHICHDCGAGFVQKCAYDRHLASHSDLRPWKCVFCNKHFKLKEYLHQHKLNQHPDIMRDVLLFKSSASASDASDSDAASASSASDADAEIAVLGHIHALTQQRNQARDIAASLLRSLLDAGFLVQKDTLAIINDF